MKRKALTLIEIIVATVILAITTTGLANLYIAGKRWIYHSRSRISGGELGKLFIDPLQEFVREDTWGQAGNALNIGTTYCDSDPAHAGSQNPLCIAMGMDGAAGEPNRTIDGTVYSVTYNISAHPRDSNIRKVDIIIRVEELSPE